MKINFQSLLILLFTLLTLSACSNTSDDSSAPQLPDISGTYTGIIENTTETLIIQKDNTFLWTKHNGQMFKGSIIQQSVSKLIFRTTHKKNPNTEWQESPSEYQAAYTNNSIKLTIQGHSFTFRKQ